MSTVLRTLFAGSLIALVVVTGCNAEFGARAVRGSGVIATETREVAGFTEVDASGAGDVTIEQTGVESVTVEADENLLPLLETSVSNGVLSLGQKRNTSIRPTRPIRYRITVKDLSGIVISGSASVRATGVDTSKLACEISGSGDARVSGRADAVDVAISGSGSVDARSLTSKTAKVTISGSGEAMVNAADRLQANVSGSGSVSYVGNPSVKKQVSGSGNVSPRSAS